MAVKGLKRWLRGFAGFPWRLLAKVIPKAPRLVAVNTFPDYDDTTRALARALSGTDLKLAILTTSRESERPSWLPESNVEIAYRYGPRGVWLYHRARFVIFTHGCFSAWTPDDAQVVVNVWHGMPLKRIGLLDGKSPSQIPRFHLTIAADDRFQPIMAAAFGVARERVLVADHPRLDMMRSDADHVRATLPDHRSLVVWLPTYRASVKGDVRIDGSERGDVFSGAVDLTRIDEMLTRHGALCVIKPHPMARVDATKLSGLRSFLFLDDAALGRRGLSLYQLLGASDLLVTDVSSVYFDYLALGRPVLLFCPDLQEYRSSRGFVAPIEELVKQPVIEREEALLERLEETLASLGGRPRAQAAGPQAARTLLRRIGALP